MASQQGKYLGRKLTKFAKQRNTLAENGLLWGPGADEAIAGPFRYLHLGSLAYIGNAAVFDLGKLSFMGGLVAMYAWRSVYWSEQVSSRTRALLMIDWIVRCVRMSLLGCLGSAANGRLDWAGAFGEEICRSCEDAAAGNLVSMPDRLSFLTRAVDLRHSDGPH